MGESESLKKTIAVTEKAIKSEHLTVLILGETGTGKELIAKAIHYNSANRQEPFIEINCSTIPETLLESEFFGYEKGAFTDAKQRKIGLFESAGTGTIFLDEIGSISTAIQSKLLKVIEEKMMRRLGGVNNIPVRARIIAAAGEELPDLVSSGLFRKDLFYRLNILTVHLPPLRERRQDIKPLAAHFLQHFKSIYNASVVGFTEEAMEYLEKQQWEGNVRELKNAVERAVVLCEKPLISSNHLSTADQSGPQKTSQRHESAGDQITLNISMENASVNAVQQLLIKEVLRSVHGKKSAAAKILKISRSRLDRIIGDHPDFFSR